MRLTALSNSHRSIDSPFTRATTAGMFAGIGLMAGGVAAGCPLGGPAGALAVFAGGAGAVDPLVEVEGEEDAGGATDVDPLEGAAAGVDDDAGACLRHDGNASETASTRK